MKTILILLLSLSSSLVLAETPNPSPSPTIFSILQSWYDQSRNVKWSEIKGSYSGRCYFINKPDQPYPYILTYVNPANDNGPGFPSKLPLMISALQWPDSSKTFQDYDNAPAEKVKELQRDLGKMTKHGAGVTEDPTVTHKFDIEPNFRVDFLEQYRVHSDGYIVNRVTNLIAQNISFQSGNVFVKAGEVPVMCYFFKQVGE